MAEFMEEYEKTAAPFIGIPRIEMNAPIVPTNALGDVGLELEIEGDNLPSGGKLARIVAKDSRAVWHAKTDGSLRGEALEYVLSTPCKVDEVADMVNNLYTSFKTNDTTLRLTNRCSTHVHVNMSGKKVNEITSAIALWTAFEEPLTLWAGEERVNNHFCLGAKDCNNGTIPAWRAFLNTGKTNFNDNLKYSALNILTLYRFGSLEYRVMNASEDPQRIIDWTKFVFHLTKFATEEFANPATMAYSMSERGGRELFLQICDKAGVSAEFVTGVMDTVPDMNTAVMTGFRRAQPLVAGFPWHDWYEECKKEYVIDPFGGKKNKKRIALDFEPIAIDPIDVPRPALRPREVRPLFAGQDVVANPDAAPDRPDFLSEDFVYVRGQWVNFNYSVAEHGRRVMQRPAIEYTPYNTVRGFPISTANIQDNKVKFYNHRSEVVCTGTIIAYDRDRNIMQVIADDNIVAPNGTRLGEVAYWYDIRTGFWDGDRTIGFVH